MPGAAGGLRESMTKKEFRQFQKLPSERDYLIRKIERLERQAENVPTVKTKVQASQKEYPYTIMHVTVDAPEPVRYTSIKRDIRRSQLRLKEVERRLDKLNSMIASIDDSRTRQIMTMRYVDGEKLMDVSLKMDLTDVHVLRIINAAIKKF